MIIKKSSWHFKLNMKMSKGLMHRSMRNSMTILQYLNITVRSLMILAFKTVLGIILLSMAFFVILAAGVAVYTTFMPDFIQHITNNKILEISILSLIGLVSILIAFVMIECLDRLFKYIKYKRSYLYRSQGERTKTYNFFESLKSKLSRFNITVHFYRK